MHIVKKCIETLDVTHNAHMNWSQQMPSLLGPLVAGGNYCNKNLPEESQFISNIH